MKEDIQQYVEPLLTNLFKAFTLPGSAENEYIMKGNQQRATQKLSLLGTLSRTGLELREFIKYSLLLWGYGSFTNTETGLGSLWGEGSLSQKWVQ